VGRIAVNGDDTNRKHRGGKTVAQDLLRDGDGHFFRGNLHCHSDLSDGQWSPEDVARAYRDAGYDFLCLSDHFEAEYGWRITDTRPCATRTSPRSSAPS
jgi:hypothetical protein